MNDGLQTSLFEDPIAAFTRGGDHQLVTTTVLELMSEIGGKASFQHLVIVGNWWAPWARTALQGLLDMLVSDGDIVRVLGFGESALYELTPEIVNRMKEW